MKIGPLKHRVEFRENQPTINDYGERVEAWVIVKTPFASVEPLLGRELFTAESVQSKVTVKVRTRYFDEANDRMQIWHKGNKYRIESAVPVMENGREMLFYCSKVVE